MLAVCLIKPGASEYFQRTESIAGVKVIQPMENVSPQFLLIDLQDMRFQALMPDVRIFFIRYASADHIGP